jgi:hypothetical protein
LCSSRLLRRTLKYVSERAPRTPRASPRSLHLRHPNPTPASLACRSAIARSGPGTLTMRYAHAPTPATASNTLSALSHYSHLFVKKRKNRPPTRNASGGQLSCQKKRRSE